MTTAKKKQNKPTNPVDAAARVIKIATGESDAKPERRIIITFHSPVPKPRDEVRDADG